MRALLALAEAVRIVEADIDAGYQIGREAHEPIVLIIVCRAGLAGKRLADAAAEASGTALDDALQYRDDLVGARRVDDRLARIGQLRRRLAAPCDVAAAFAAARIGPGDGLAVAILDAIDKARRDALATIDQHGVGGGETQRRRLAGAEQHGVLQRHAIEDAERLDGLRHLLEPDDGAEPRRHHILRLLDADAQRRRPVERRRVVVRRLPFW